MGKKTFPQCSPFVSVSYRKRCGFLIKVISLLRVRSQENGNKIVIFIMDKS